jgi:hypothetical protein
MKNWAYIVKSQNNTVQSLWMHGCKGGKLVGQNYSSNDWEELLLRGKTVVATAVVVAVVVVHKKTWEISSPSTLKIWSTNKSSFDYNESRPIL